MGNGFRMNGDQRFGKQPFHGHAQLRRLQPGGCRKLIERRRPIRLPDQRQQHFALEGMKIIHEQGCGPMPLLSMSGCNPRGAGGRLMPGSERRNGSGIVIRRKYG